MCAGLQPYVRMAATLCAQGCNPMCAGLWESTLLVFVSDNGGPTNGNEGTASNNYPMRGGKNTLWGRTVTLPSCCCHSSLP